MTLAEKAGMFVVLIILFNASWTLAGPVPDTGQTYRARPTFVGRDSDYIINPPSYTKLDALGKKLPDSASKWAMVRDNITGLIWEVKTDDSSIHDRDDTYDWQDATKVFVKALNKSKFGGFSDWRLPTVKELSSIVHRDAFLPATDKSYSPFVKAYDYWSSSTSAQNDKSAWRVHFCRGYVSQLNKSNQYHVRAVRGGNKTLMAFVDNDDGTVTDPSTGLMWQKEMGGKMNWGDALSYCENLSLAGHSDWRLPNTNELQSVMDYGRFGPSSDPEFFTGTIITESSLTLYSPAYWSSSYWSSTEYASNREGAWRVVFVDGAFCHNKKTHSYFVRAVRGGQNQGNDSLLITAPIQGSVVRAGQPMSIKWKTRGLDGNVTISLSRQGGRKGTFKEIIAENAENDGHYDWTVTEGKSVNCVLRIEHLKVPSKGTAEGLFSGAVF